MPTLSRPQRKNTGSFYTPEPLARLLAREVLACLSPNTPLQNLCILDPAAGEGGLLLPFAQELAKQRQIQEPEHCYSDILQDILTRQLHAADISANALDMYQLKAMDLIQKPIELQKHLTDALSVQKGHFLLQTFAPQGYDVILANPPYIGQKGHASLFKKLRNNPLWKSYVTPQSDLLYYFFYLALHLLKPSGLAGFITPPYFTTAAGGKLLRQTLRQEASFLRLINFEEQYLFKDAHPHTLLSVFQREIQPVPCRVGLKNPTQLSQTQLFYGPDYFLQTTPPASDTNLVDRMAQAPHTLGEIAKVSNGLMTGCDSAFILTDAQKRALPLTPSELTKLQPFFKNSDIAPYVPNTIPRLWLIDLFYPNDKDINIHEYPHLLAHLTQFKGKLLARKQNNNGIDKQLKQGKFWFASVRRKMDFEQDKIVLPHRSKTVTAALSQGPWYASSDVYFITAPKPPYTLWTLLGLLNSTPYLTWLQTHGKRKGELLELYSAPLQQLPIPKLTAQQQAQIEQLARKIYRQKQAANCHTRPLQRQLDEVIINCF
ncbi:MAG: N-6 DNA methylase [Elusimicrobiaceae bacterium]|nr:N-6 DNA methylase [Elusimicrobiaceae bacterium]